MSTQSDRSSPVSAHPRSSNGRGEDYADLFGQAPVIFAALSGPKHALEAANSAFFDVFGGDRGSAGAPIGDVMPELVSQGVLNQLDTVYYTGIVHRARGERLVLGRPGQEREGFFDVTYEPRRDVFGQIDGVVMIAVETTAYHQAQLLAAEQCALLEQIAREVPLEETLSGMAKAIEEFSSEMLVSVLLVDPDGQHLRHGAGPSLPDFYNEAVDGASIGEGVGSCGTAAYRRAPVVVTDIAKDPLWKDFRGTALRAGLAACWSTPIEGTDGHLLGTFAMYHHRPKSPDSTDVALSAAFARIAALAIERHRALEAGRAARAREREAREDLAFVLEASTAIAREPLYTDSLRCMAHLVVPALARSCAVHVAESGHARRVAVAAATGAEEEALDAPELRDQIDKAVARVLACGSTEADRIEADPGGLAERLGVTDYACVPLTTRGRTFGVLTLLATDQPFDHHIIALAEELARRAAISADNAHQFTYRVQLARDLQAGLLPPELPRIPGATLAASYHPAGEGLEVGGDFYDVFPLSDGRWALMIGDVCGRGAVAATTTGMVRHTARAVARLGGEAAVVVRAINDALTDGMGDDDCFVSLVYGELRHTGSFLALDLIRAGHVPPLMRRADGTVEELAQSGLLLGIAADIDESVHSVELYSGDSLVLVTDGITEARSPAGEFFGEDRLADVLAMPRAASFDAAALIDSIAGAVATFAGGSPLDDQAALILTAT
jgi:serine phosphatase RsbU (regulator of sigma subunit)